MAIILPQDSPQPIQAPRLQPQADETTFGGGPGLEAEGQQVQRIAASGGEIATFEKLRADQTAAEEVQAKLSGAYNDILYNPQTGVLGARGSDALKAQEEGRKRFEDVSKEAMKGLRDPQQIGAMQKWILLQARDFNKVTMVHADQQMTAHDVASNKELITQQTAKAALGHGDPEIIQNALNTIDDNLDHFGNRHRLDQQAKDEMKSDVHGQFHSAVITEMADQAFYDKANAYFKANMEDIAPKFRKDIQDYLDIAPKQKQVADKAAEAERYKGNMRQAMIDMFDGKLTLSEAQRRFRDNELDKADYDILESRLSKPDAAVIRKELVSDPATFNAIRQAQLTGSESPGEIQRMIARGAASKDITPDDGKYLMGLSSEKPPTPRDKYIKAQADSIKDFGDRYFAETNFLGHPTNQNKTNKESETIVNDFYNMVDKARANGEDIDKIRDQVLKKAATQRYPGLGKLEKMPDIVIDVTGKITRLLNPEQHSGLKPKYKITPATTAERDSKEE